MVRTPVPLPKAMKIPAAKKAVDEEWDKLENKRAWDITKMRSKKSVQAEAKRKGKKVHFGSLMALCHMKHAELEEFL